MHVDDDEDLNYDQDNEQEGAAILSTGHSDASFLPFSSVMDMIFFVLRYKTR